jgi:hypothetical protein
MDLTKLISQFESTYYTEPLVLIANIIGISLALRKGSRIENYFVLYFTFNVLVLLTSWTMFLAPSIASSSRKIITNTLNSFVSLIELFVYVVFFSLIIKNIRIQKLLKGSLIIFSSLIILFLFTRFAFVTPRYHYVSYLLSVIEFLIVILASLTYFYELIKTDSTIKLKERPSFWVATGILIFAVISVPYYLLDTILWDINYRWRNLFGTFLFELPLLLNLLFLIKAFTCKKALTI